MRPFLAEANLDFIGFSASLICAIHCMAVPFLVSALPLLGLGFLANHWIEYTVIGLSVFLAAGALSHGFRVHHRKPLPLLLVVSGFAVILAGLIWGHGPEAHLVAPSGPLHLLATADTEPRLLHFITPIGALLVAIGHLANWFYIKKSKHPAPTQK